MRAHTEKNHKRNLPSPLRGLLVLLLAFVLSFTFSACGRESGVVPANLEDMLPDDSAAAVEPESEEELLLLSSVRISEIMPSNGATLFDSDGDSSDWLELVNTGNRPVSLSGCRLSLHSEGTDAWEFPELTLSPGEHIVLFCSGKNRTEGELHLSFSLQKTGGSLFLFSPSGSIIDSVSWEETGKDYSVFYLSGDGLSLESGRITTQATPGYPNTDAGYEAFLASNDRHGALVLNEAVSYNRTYAEKPGRYFDWLELKNTSEEDLSLGGYTLSDDPECIDKVRLPDQVLKPGEVFLVFCSGDSALTSQNGFHACFAIGTDEILYLYDPDGMLSDCMHLRGLPLDGSMGRMDGESGFWYFASPTPMKNNLEGCRAVCEKPVPSLNPGVYETDETLSLELSGEGEIHYTLDGSVPDATDPVYIEALSLSKTTILRAVCMQAGKITCAPATFSYIINEHDSLPVTSLVCDPKEMFGYNGVYTSIKNRNVQCDASVSFFDADGSGFTADCSAELHGAHSRTTYKKKSFELKFGNRYGGDVEYDLFGDGSRTRFSSLLLRGGSISDLDLVRDTFASKLMVEFCPWLYPQNYRYTAVYINGQYYGVYAWREAYSEQYFSVHTGMPEDGITMARGPVQSGELLSLLQEITTRNMASDEAYESVAERLDLTSLAGWMAIQSYFDNQDINGNIRYVRLSQGGKWQLIVYDLDYSCLNGETGWDTVLVTYQLGNACRSLLANENFRTLLLETCAELYHSGFTTEGILQSFDELIAPLDDETTQKDCTRWNDDFAKWQRYQKSMRDHLGDPRMQNWLENLQDLTHATAEEMHACFPDYY